MSRLSVVRNLTRGVFRSGHASFLGHRHVVRLLSDDSSDSSSQPVVSNLKVAEIEKPLAQTSPRFVWPDVQERTDNGFTATWDFKNNELDVEQLAGLPGPNEAEDPYSLSELEDETCEDEDEEHRKFQEELQFGRMIALREQLNRELCSSESFTKDERSSLDSVRENVDFMMQELSQISFMLKSLYPVEENATKCEAAEPMIQEDCVLGTVYTEPQIASWVYTHPSLNSNKAHADVSNVGEKEEETVGSQQDSVSPVMASETVPEIKEVQLEDKESPVMTSEAEALPKEEQLSSEALDEVIASDDSQKVTPAKPSESTPSRNPNPNRDGRQVAQPQETIHTYKPFRIIDVPTPKPNQNHEQLPVQDEPAVVERTENSPMKEGFTVSAQLSESESRFLMQMALKQALSNLESGRSHYKATVLMAEDEESQGVD